MTLTTCDDCRRSTSGSCPLHPRTFSTPPRQEEPAGVGTMLAVSMWQECAQGRHAWTPWLALPNGSFVTICGRDGCTAEKQYDL